MNFDKRLKAKLLLLLAGLSSAAVNASHVPLKDEPTKAQLSKFSRPFLKQGHTVVQLGGYWGTFGKSQHVNIQGLIGDNFKTTNHASANGSFGLGFYVSGQPIRQFNMSYGINGFYLSKTAASGTVTQENLFTNLSYRYNARHIPVYAIAKASRSLKNDAYALTVDAGIGPNFMRVGGFEEYSLDDGVTIPDNGFKGRSSTTFSATVGVGIKKNKVFSNASLGCGYRFYYLGQSHLNPVTNQIVNTLDTGSVFGNAIMCAVTV